MIDSDDTMNEAMRLQSEAAEELEAARAEQQIGSPTVSLQLLRDAIEKEREGLDLQEQSLIKQREAIQERRKSLEQQEQVLDELLTQMAGQG